MGIFRFIKELIHPTEVSHYEPIVIHEPIIEKKPVQQSQKQDDPIARDVRYYNNKKHDRDDNMNCDLYEGRARFAETNRMRKVELCVFPDEDVNQALTEAGYLLEGAEVARVSFPRPTDAQIATMKSHNDPIPENVSKEDISALMDRIINGDKEPAPQYLFDFAEQYRIVASRFTGFRYMHLTIWNNLDENQCLGFFLLCVRKYKYGKWDPEKFNEYCEMYDSLMSDSSFSNSFNNFLSHGFYGFDSNTGIRSNAFKIAKEKVWI